MRFMQLLIALFGLLAVEAPLAAQVAPAAAPVAAQAAPAAASTDGYQIGPEDVVEVDVLGQQDFRSRVKVKSDGTIPLPYIGNVQAAGYTAITLAQVVYSRLKTAGIFAEPVVNVEVVSYASRYIIALGELSAPGLVPVDRAYRLSEILARVGGIKPTGTTYVILTRQGQPEMKLTFDNLAKGTEQDDPLVQPGDKIFVPKADRYYLSGAIKSPGEYVLSDVLTIRKALARAGGVSANGSPSKVKIFRDGREIKHVNLETVVQPGDSIVVGERLF